jgi:hypothetical protein
LRKGNNPVEAGAIEYQPVATVLNVTPTSLTFTGVVQGTDSAMQNLTHRRQECNRLGRIIGHDTNVHPNRYGESIPANPLEWNAVRGFGCGQHCRKDR